MNFEGIHSYDLLYAKSRRCPKPTALTLAKEIKLSLAHSSLHPDLISGARTIDLFEDRIFFDNPCPPQKTDSNLYKKWIASRVTKVLETTAIADYAIFTDGSHDPDMDKAMAAVIGVKSTNSTESEVKALQKAIDLLLPSHSSSSSNTGLSGRIVLYTDSQPAIDLFLNTKGTHDRMSSVHASKTLR
ncbi:hypothetical protein AMATHDRAFT_8932 [Amanita thiersii Skay4041]|uniref:Uncharacterized protein n=1 Tax=Amanita thiersii Skay4041 TaxID=703135 RepID=A0A2A9N6G3_9AGAR|nr:hypothetical protein AMATHDRAFT_8932 [Amanita thiersii Skay4041]